jgi:predicted acyl esterase
MRRLPLLLLTLFALVLPTTALAADPPEGSEWTEEYFQSLDGTKLHADVLRPKGLPADAKTPVLLTVSPYVSHTAQTGADYDPNKKGPSDRFYDFIVPNKIFERGYTYVMVQLRGTGGSAGCGEWGGAGERGDVKAAVEWAASQKWSTGKVGMLGKSYDGWTGLMGLAERPKGLAAVLTMEPVYSGYRYFWTNGVRISNTFGTPASFTLTDIAPGGTSDSPEYLINSAPGAQCHATNVPQESALDSEDNAFWVPRNLIPPLKGVTTPTFLTQGLLEANTKPDGAFDVFRDLVGYKHAWFGQFDHVRGYEKIGEEFATGRDGFMAEAIQFFDHFVRGDGAQPTAPTVEVQDNKGRYRAETAWPPADATPVRSKLNDGSYTDDASNEGQGAAGGQGVWSVSQPLPYGAHMAGEPVVRAAVSGTTPRTNFTANVYDVAPDNTAVLVTRGTTLTRTNELELKLYGQDWVFDAGHRIGVLISSSNSEWWQHVPSQQLVNVAGASVEIPFLKFERTAFLSGAATTRLTGHLDTAKITAPAGGEAAFTLPPALAPMPVPAGGAPQTLKPTKDKLTVKVKRSGKGLVVSGRAPRNAVVSITALKGRKSVQSAIKKTKTGKFSIKLKKAGKATSVVVRAAGLRSVKKVPKAKKKRR